MVIVRTASSGVYAKEFGETHRFGLKRKSGHERRPGPQMPDKNGRGGKKASGAVRRHFSAASPFELTGARVSEAAGAPFGVVQFRNGFEDDLRHGLKHHLGDPLVSFHRKRLLTQIDEQHFDFSPVI